jgi:prepilin-type N-terminal cleavage/methylation domain-containing protein
MEIPMFLNRKKPPQGFTLIELVIIIVVLGILAAVAVPKFVNISKEAEEASVTTVVSSLDAALSMYAAKHHLEGQPLIVHNPFDDLSNVPSNYRGANDPITPDNTPNGTWSWRPAGNWIVYNPKASISGGWLNGSERFIIYRVEPVVDGADTVGLILTTTESYTYSWN